MKHQTCVQHVGRRAVARALVIITLAGLASQATAANLDPSALRVAVAGPRARATTGIALDHSIGRSLQPDGVVVRIDPATAHGAGRKSIKELAACFAAGLTLGATLSTAAGGFVGVGIAATAALIACL